MNRWRQWIAWVREKWNLGAMQWGILSKLLTKRKVNEMRAKHKHWGNQAATREDISVDKMRLLHCWVQASFRLHQVLMIAPFPLFARRTFRRIDFFEHLHETETTSARRVLDALPRDVVEIVFTPESSKWCSDIEDLWKRRREEQLQSYNQIRFVQFTALGTVNCSDDCATAEQWKNAN